MYLSIFRTLVVSVFFMISNGTYAQLDSVINSLIDKYSKSDNFTIFIPEETNMLKFGDEYLDSIILLDYKNSFYSYFKLMDSLASDADLIKMTSHSSPIIQFYSAYLLGQRDTLLLPSVLVSMLDNPLYALDSKGDTNFNEISAFMILSSLSERKQATGYPSDMFMDSLYSIILLHKNTPKIKIRMFLYHLRSESLKPTIEFLAFERRNFSAILYLDKWYKGEYYSKLNTVYLEILDSNIVDCLVPVTKNIIENIIDLKDQETLRKLGGWLKNNREKWTRIKGIDDVLDKSFSIRDSVKWGPERYPFEIDEVSFLLKEWVILSGLNIEKFESMDTIVLEQKTNQKGYYQKIAFFKNTGGLSSRYYQNLHDEKPSRIGTPCFDVSNQRINFSSSNWDWYKIIQDKNRLIEVAK